MDNVNLSVPDMGADRGGDAPAASLPRMAVRLGELGLLLPWDGGREVLPAPSVSRIPNTAVWLRGVANVRGALVPVVDVAAAVGMERADGVPAYLLICGEGDKALGLLIDGLPRILEIGLASAIPDRASAPFPLEDSVIAAYESGGRVWLDVDLESLFKTLAHNVSSV